MGGGSSQWMLASGWCSGCALTCSSRYFRLSGPCACCGPHQWTPCTCLYGHRSSPAVLSVQQSSCPYEWSRWNRSSSLSSQVSARCPVEFPSILVPSSSSFLSSGLTCCPPSWYRIVELSIRRWSAGEVTPQESGMEGTRSKRVATMMV